MSLLLLFAFGCVGPDDPSTKDTGDTGDTDTRDTAPVDADGDGYDDTEDCDDAAADVHPDATETCDLRDEDCDGLVDEESPWYPDSDGDGFGGAGEEPVYACDAPAGYVADASDCDDHQAESHPGAIERCDYVDDDCDGEYEDVDDTDMTVWRDADADGAGDSAAAWDVCSYFADTTGYAPEAGDCDDTDPTISPYVDETCDDGIDNNCDGVDSVCPVDVVSLANADVKYIGGSDGTYPEYYSVGFVAGAGDVNADGFADLLVADQYGDSASGYNSGNAHLILGGPAMSGGSLAAADARYTGSSEYDYAFNWVSRAGDLDGDGFGDLVLGASHDSRVYVLRGEATPGDRLTSAADAVWEGVGVGDGAGFSVAAAGDFDGDGHADFAVSAHSAGDGVSTLGAVYVVGGASVMSGGSLGDVPAIWGEPESYPWVVAGAGDTDGDGLDDLVVGSLSDGPGDEYSGAAWLVLGSTSGGDTTLASAAAKYLGEAAGDWAGNAVAGGGDANADGYADLLVGALYNEHGGTDAGAVYVILGGTSPASGSLADADAVIVGQAGDLLAATGGPPANPLAFAGDLDGDGDDELLLGAAGLGDGGVYVVSGAPGIASHIAAAEDTLILADSPNGLGVSVAGPGDVDGDGTPDLFFSAENDDDGGTDVGAAYLMFGLP